MKKTFPSILKILFIVLFGYNSLGQTKSTAKSITKQVVNSSGIIVISTNKSCIISINGTQVDVLNENEIKSIKYPVGNILLKGEMTFDRSIFILREAMVSKINNTVIVLDFETKQKEQKQKEEENNNKIKESTIHSAIVNYKNFLYLADCKSVLLDSQLNSIIRLDYLHIKGCNSCSGKGEVTVQVECNVCGGTSIIACVYCTNGEASCQNCKGIGKVKCSCAYETIGDLLLKRYHYNPYCSICGGNAGGRGELSCNSCGGSGKVTCYYCKGSGQKKCSYCKNGYLNSKKCCDECKGMGRIVE